MDTALVLVEPLQRQPPFELRFQIALRWPCPHTFDTIHSLAAVPLTIYPILVQVVFKLAHLIAQ